jgi:UDP-N-acetylmuramoyl-tripeptide--D-alanyl-D-alanine ligase
MINRAVPFSDPTGVELVLEMIPSDLNLKLSVNYLHHTYNLNTNLFGSYNLENVRTAIATGLFFDVEIKDIIDAVEKYHPANNRSQLKATKNNTLICDSYNANPTSMTVALKAFSEINAEKKIAILGDMLELGDKSIEEHQKILNILQAENLEMVFLVGPQFQKIAKESGLKTFWSVENLKEFLKETQLKGYTILIKGSRGIGLEKTYELL